MKQALIVVDVQESFRKRPYWKGDDLPAFLKNVQSLIDLASARAIPIVQVFHQVALSREMIRAGNNLTGD